MSTIADLFAEVWKCLQTGNTSGAETLCRQILSMDPGYVKAHVCLGVALFQQRRFKEAEASFRQALAIQPDNGFVHHNLTSVLLLRNRNAEALEHSRKALQLLPDYAQAWRNWATSCMENSQFDEAVAGVDKALQLQADFADAHMMRSHIHLLLGDLARGWPEYQWRDAPKRAPA